MLVGGRLLDVLHLDVLLQSPNSIMETMPYKLSRRKFKPAYNSADEEIDQFERTLPVRRNFKPAKLFPVDYVSVNNEEDAAIVYGTNNVSSSDEDVGLLHRSDMSDRSSADSPLFKEDSADGLSYEPLSPILTLSDIPAAKAVSDPNATQVCSFTWFLLCFEGILICVLSFSMEYIYFFIIIFLGIA